MNCHNKEYYKEHTKQRFIERFKNKPISELKDDDYYNICNICRNGHRIIQKNNKTGGGVKMLISYNNIFMWCVFYKKANVVRTIYNIDNGDRNKINLLYKKQKI
jgi:hypothetical protein